MSAGGTAEKPLVSVVIVNFNGGAVIGPCLGSVLAQSYRPVEVVVVDNGSRDGSAGAIRERFPEVRLLPNDRNLGFAGGSNQGVAAASGDYVVLLNSDTVVDDDWIPPLLDTLADPAVGAVTSRVVTDGVPAAFYEMNGTINYIGYNIMRHFRDLSRVFFAGGASVMFRRHQVGAPFPGEYFLYHEDVHLSWRLRLAGYDVRMAQRSRVSHRGGDAVQRQPGRLITFYQERNRLLNVLFFFEARTLRKLLPLLMADAVAKTILSLVAGRKSPAGILRAYLWIVTRAGWIRRERAILQRGRSVPDREILPLLSSRVVDGDGFWAGLLNRSARRYAAWTGLL